MDFIDDISTESVLELIKSEYFSATGKQIQIGSDAFAIATVVAYIFGVLVQRFNAQAKQRYISTATGEYLNAIAETFDIQRPAPIHATCLMDVTVEGYGTVYLQAGSFIVSDENGILFTPQEDLTLTSPGDTDVPFIGVDKNPDVLAENNIDIGAITTIDTPITGVTAVTNSTVTGGAKDTFPNTDEGDDLFREYIIQKRSAMSGGGPAAAYEQRALEADGRVLDSYCTRYTDSWYEPNKAKVYIGLGDIDSDTADIVVSRVETALLDPSWKPVCDIVEVYQANAVSIQMSITVGLSAQYSVSGRAKFEADLDAYKSHLMSHLGEAFSVSELARRALTPDSDGVKCEYVQLYNPAQNYIPVERRKWAKIVAGVTYVIV